jgi:RNA polymerase sigma-70 factor (ECF subfamily)
MQTKTVVPRGHKLTVVCNLADEQLLIEAAQQDPSRFAELYENNFHRVYAFVARRVRDRAEAEDVTAEVFHEALRNLRRFQWRGAPFAAWLLRIAANTLADRWQRSGRNDVVAVDDLGGAEISVQAEAERRAMLSQLVDRLPSDQRLVIIRRFVDQKNAREIAQELGRSEGAVKQLQFRALQTLRRHTETTCCDQALRSQHNKGRSNHE